MSEAPPKGPSSPQRRRALRHIQRSALARVRACCLEVQSLRLPEGCSPVGVDVKGNCVEDGMQERSKQLTRASASVRRPLTD